LEETKLLIEQRHSIHGEIAIPGDKSISHRAVVLAAISSGVTEIDGFLLSEECIHTIDSLRKMGVKIEICPNNKLRVHGNGIHGLKKPPSHLDVGRSGTALRLVLSLVCGQQFNTVIVRENTSRKKAVSKLLRALKQQGASVNGRDENNFSPIVTAPSRLDGSNFTLSIHDSILKTPILISGLYSNGSTKVIEQTKSRNHTELLLSYLGANIVVDGNKVGVSSTEELYAKPIVIPGDISIASYFLTVGLLVDDSEIMVKNVGVNATRSGLIESYKRMGANIELMNQREFNNEPIADIKVTSSQLKGITINSEDIPSLMDEIPILLVAASVSKGKTIINNIAGLSLVENGVISLMISELSKMGAKIKETETAIEIEGVNALKGTVIESFNNPKIAMSMTIAGMIAEGETMIRKAQVLDIVYPNYISVLSNL
jgi:3-phosphoshikimate 1-carboxyvinyltransferase